VVTRVPLGRALGARRRSAQFVGTSDADRHPGRLRQITADLYLGMLDGRWHGQTEQQIIADLLTRRRPEDQPLTPPAPTVPEPGARGFHPDAGDRCPARTQNARATEPTEPQTARTAVAAQRRGAQRRFAIVDAEGYLLLAGVTRRRPHLPDADPPPAVRGGIVELHIPETLLKTLLTELAADATTSGEWAG
jgi:hypothetical protein